MVKRIFTVSLGLVAGMALIAGANKTSGVKAPSGNYNIPLWEAGKVPLAKGDGPLDAPLLTVFLPPAGKRNRADRS